MLDRTETKALQDAIEKATVGGIETHQGECYADTPTAEYGYKWRDGEARIFVEDETGAEPGNAEYVFRVRVELVAVVPTE